MIELAPRAGCSEVSSSPPSPVPCWAPTWPAHPPGTGVLCTLLGSGRRSLCPGPRRCPHSCTGSGSRARGLQWRGDPITVPPEASGRQGHPASRTSSASRPRDYGKLPLTYLTVPPREARGAVTLVFADVVEAGAAVVTGTRGARVWLPWKQRHPSGRARGRVHPYLWSLPSSLHTLIRGGRGLVGCS